MFYERFVQLCKQRGISTSKAAIDAGLSKSTVTKWKKDPSSYSGRNEAIDKLCRYFGISVSELLGTQEDEDPEAVHHLVTSQDIKFALFGGSAEITDEMYHEVLDFAAYVRQREAKKIKKERNKKE